MQRLHPASQTAAYVACLLLCLGLADDSAGEPPVVGAALRGPLTNYEAGAMRHANLIVAGRTIQLRSQRQQHLARIEVSAVLLGTPPATPITVLVKGPHPAARLGASRHTVFPGVGTERHVFLLKTSPRSLTANFHDVFEAVGKIGDAKIQALQREIALSKIQDPDRRARETLAYLVASLATRSAWTPMHAIRELARFARSRRDLIDDQLEAGLQKQLRLRRTKADRKVLQDLLRYLRRTPREAVIATTKSDPLDLHPNTNDPWRAAFEQAPEVKRTQLIDGLFANLRSQDTSRAFWALSRAEPAVRAQIVRRFAEQGTPVTLKEILRRYAAEEAIQVRLEMVRAVGLLGSESHVAWLAERGLTQRMERAALLAVARISGEAARAALTAARTRILAGKTADAAGRGRWITYLLSPAFRSSSLAR